MRLNLDRVRANVAAATTEDLLDRATVYRAGMEPEALELIDAELRSRGVTAADLDAHAAGRGATVADAGSGLAAECAFCRRPAVGTARVWHRLWGLLPLFPRTVPVCAAHQADPRAG